MISSRGWIACRRCARGHQRLDPRLGTAPGARRAHDHRLEVFDHRRAVARLRLQADARHDDRDHAHPLFELTRDERRRDLGELAATDCTIARPRPLPPRARAAPARVKRSKARGRKASGNPGPLSQMCSSTRPSEAWARRRTIPAPCVSALSTRSSSAYSTRRRSACAASSPTPATSCAPPRRRGRGRGADDQHVRAAERRDARGEQPHRFATLEGALAIHDERAVRHASQPRARQQGRVRLAGAAACTAPARSMTWTKLSSASVLQWSRSEGPRLVEVRGYGRCSVGTPRRGLVAYMKFACGSGCAA